MRRTTHVVHIPTYDIALLCMRPSPWRCGGGGDRARRDDVAVVYHSDYARDEGGRRLAATRTARPHRQGVSGAPALPHIRYTYIYARGIIRIFHPPPPQLFSIPTHTHTHTHTQDKCLYLYIYICIPNNNIYALDRRRRLRSVPPPPYVLQRAGHVAPRYIVARTRRRAVIRSPATVTDGTLLLHSTPTAAPRTRTEKRPPPPPPPPPPPIPPTPPPDQTARRVSISLSTRDRPVVVPPVHHIITKSLLTNEIIITALRYFIILICYYYNYSI